MVKSKTFVKDKEDKLVPLQSAIDANKIFKKRLIMLEKLQDDDEFLAALLRRYKYDPAAFIEDWFVTLDPRFNPGLLPFILFPKQIEYLYWLKKNFEDRENCVVKKSRDMGITYINCAFSVWLFIFWPGTKIGFGSVNRDKVDRLADPDSIFEKIRIILQYLPNELLPIGFNFDKHCLFMRIINPQNANTITGEIGLKIGRGGRNTVYFKDESAHYENPEKIEASLSANTDCQIDVSTPNGTGNPFYKKCVGGEFPVFTFHWKDDPRKTEKWYKKQVRQKGRVVVNQEYDIDFSGSVERICIPAEWVQAAIDFRISPSGQKIMGFDVADEGGDENAAIWRHGVVVPGLKAIEHWREGNTGQGTRRALNTCKINDIQLFKYDNIGVGAGVKSEVYNWNDRPNEKFKVVPQGINYGSKKLKGYYAAGKLNKDMFVNLKAMLWWELRRRFERTFEVKNRQRKWSSDKLISIPNHPQLILELSQPKFEFNSGTGKIQIEKKANMKRRGIVSPNLADALVVCFSRPIGLDYSMITKA